MTKHKLKYLGNGPGQAGSVSIAGYIFERGRVYHIDSKFAAALVARGGFEFVKPKRRKAENGNR